jgi:hypothetical protein
MSTRSAGRERQRFFRSGVPNYVLSFVDFSAR